MMKQLKGNGIPTKKTKGALGDIYTDTSTGKKYKCIFSYRDNDDADFDCQWKELTDAKENKPVVKSEEPKKAVTKPVVEEKQAVEEVKEEVKPEPKKHTCKTNYAAAYNKK